MPGKVLVTGAAGFIGSHLVEHLLDQGKDVRALVRYNSQGSIGWLSQLSPQHHAQIEILFGDVRDSRSAKAAVDGCSTVFNLAALIGIPYSYQAPDAYVDVNINGCLNLLEAARGQGIEKFVQMSSSEVYGTALSVPISEEHPLQPQSPYSATKIAADNLALSYYHAFDLPVAIARPFNTYGERQSTRAIIPTVITQILHGTQELKLGALSPTRDFNYVADTVDGLTRIGESPLTSGRAINIGSNFEISISDLVMLIAKTMNKQVTVVSDSERVRPPASEVVRLWADNSLAKKLLGWEPQFGGVEGLGRALENVIQWFDQPKNLAAYRSNGYHV